MAGDEVATLLPQRAGGLPGTCVDYCDRLENRIYNFSRKIGIPHPRQVNVGQDRSTFSGGKGSLHSKQHVFHGKEPSNALDLIVGLKLLNLVECAFKECFNFGYRFVSHLALLRHDRSGAAQASHRLPSRPLYARAVGV